LGLAVASRDNSHITIIWIDKTRGETGYAVERATTGAFTQLAPLTKKNAESFADSGLSSATTYTYRVRPFHDNTKGVRTWGPYSANLVASTTGPPADTIAPPVPTGLTVSVSSC